jgi:hypothetical protein
VLDLLGVGQPQVGVVLELEGEEVLLDALLQGLGFRRGRLLCTPR